MELLIRVVDKVDPDNPELNARQSKRGDVIAIRPDGWNWGTQELINPEWRIISSPNMTEAQAKILLRVDDSDSTKIRLRSSRLKLNSPNLSQEAKDSLADATRAVRACSCPLIMNQIARKPAL